MWSSAVAASANVVLSDPSKEKDREIGGHSSHVEQITGSKATHSNNVEVARISVEEIRDSDAAGSASEGAKGDGGEIKSIPTAHEFSADSPVMVPPSLSLSHTHTHTCARDPLLLLSISLCI